MHENIVIIGRPNVGKSTLFNRLTGTRRAIVHHEPGTTRDRNDAPVTWKDREFTLVDTAGWSEDETIFSEAVKRQLSAAQVDADLVLFLADGKNGLHPYDAHIAGLLRKENKPVVLVVNKIDTAADELKAAEFYRLGISDMVAISANQGRNITELLDHIVAHIAPPEGYVPQPPAPVKIILVGKPNVGKSSLINALSHEERSIVHDTPGTTREALDTTITRDNEQFILIDTPGLHRKRKFRDDMEYLSALSAHHAMDRADVAVIVMDASQGIGETEARVAQLVLEKRKAVLLVINKWDLAEEKEAKVADIRRQFDEKLPFLWWSRLVLISAKTGQRIERVLQEVREIYGEYSRIVPQDELNDTIRTAETRRPMTRQGRVLRIRSVRQAGIQPPTFVFGVNDTELVHFSYRRYLENNLRERFGFTGTPLVLKFQEETPEKG
jgi:GTPase